MLCFCRNEYKNWDYFNVAYGLNTEDEVLEEITKTLENFLKNRGYQQRSYRETYHFFALYSEDANEVLLRWKDETGNIIPTDEYIPYLYTFGEIYLIDLKTFRSVCTYLKEGLDQD